MSGGALSGANLNEGVYAPILDLLADHGARTLGDMEAALKGAGVTFPQVLQAIMVLAGAGHVVLTCHVSSGHSFLENGPRISL